MDFIWTYLFLLNPLSKKNVNYFKQFGCIILDLINLLKKSEFSKLNNKNKMTSLSSDGRNNQNTFLPMKDFV